VQHTSHHLVSSALLLFQGSKVPVSPAFNMRFLIPAPSRRPNTMSRNRITTSWSLGESRSGNATLKSKMLLQIIHIRKHLASTSPSFPVAVSGFVLPIEAPAHMGSFWSKHHCFVQDKQGCEGLLGSVRGNITLFEPKHMPDVQRWH
jgi:hypothetical protein